MKRKTAPIGCPQVDKTCSGGMTCKVDQRMNSGKPSEVKQSRRDAKASKDESCSVRRTCKAATEQIQDSDSEVKQSKLGEKDAGNCSTRSTCNKSQ